MTPKYESPPPAKAPELKEGMIDVNFCHSPTCANFGLSWYQSVKDSKDNKKKKYSLRKGDGLYYLKCRSCEKILTLHNNQAVDSAFLWALKNTLLHEYCPHKECSNHRVNFYEHHDNYSKKDSKKYQIRCKVCYQKNRKSTFSIGTPIKLEKGKYSAASLKLFMKLICNNTGPRGVIDVLECNPDFYTARLANLANLVKDISSYYLMKLSDPKHVLDHKEICVYTDILSLSFHKHSKVDNSDLLSYIISSTNYKGSFFILAATPAFYFDPKDKISKQLKEEYSSNRNIVRGYAYCNDHLFLASAYDRLHKFHPLDVHGHFIKTSYLITAHYLVLKKVLSSVKHITLYSDGEASLSKSAISAFADRIKDNTCDVVVVKTAKGSKFVDAHTATYNYPKDDKEKASKEELKNKSFIKNILKVRHNLDALIKEKNESSKNTAFAKILKFPADKSALWVKDPDPPIHEQERRFLWITRRLEQDISYELHLYKQGRLQPIDMPFGAFRKAASFSSRPGTTAGKGGARSYDSHAKLPKNICDELIINIFYWNYQLRYLGERYLLAKKDKTKGTRGYDLKIAARKPITMKKIIDWRSDVFERAREITSWRK